MSARVPSSAQSGPRYVRGGYLMVTTDFLAYIDPGAGSILLQVLIGTIIGLGLTLRHSIARVFDLFRRGQ